MNVHVITYLSGRGDPFPQAEIADEVDGKQTERHVPLYGTQIV